MSEIAVENIDVAGTLAREGVKEKVAQVKEILESVPEVNAMMKAAETVEDVYEIVKNFSTATLEQVKVIFEKTVDYYRQAKAALTDEVLDNVVGGWSFSEFWSDNKGFVVGAAVFVASVAIGATAGACVAGPLGAAAGALGGIFAGVMLGVIAGVATEVICKNFNL